MKTSIILLLILLAGTACGPQLTLVPLINPNPIPVTAPTPVDTEITVEPSVPPCTCPTNMAAPTQPPAGFVSPDYVICNCPAILVPTPVPTAGIGSSPQTIPANGITLGDSGKTFILQPGESFLLNLGTTDFNWTVSVDNQLVLSRVRNIMVIRGAQGVYQAGQPGQAVLSAEGDPLCRTSIPACMLPSLMFQITIIVQ